jgi:hypothetical protein
MNELSVDSRGIRFLDSLCTRGAASISGDD